MAILFEITCINKSDRFDPHERILSIGGLNKDSTRWKMPQQKAVEGIEKGKYSFYVTRNGKTVGVIIATSRYGHQYLKTEADGEQPNNLLSLPECPD
jgi:hypothetical protein